jgi:hypothetical protein
MGLLNLTGIYSRSELIYDELEGVQRDVLSELCSRKDQFSVQHTRTKVYLTRLRCTGLRFEVAVALRFVQRFASLIVSRESQF